VTATTIKSGLQDTASILSNRLIVDMLEPIQMLDTNLSQFSTILDHPALRGDTLASYIKEWLEDRLMPRTMALAGGLTGTADTAVTTGTGEANYVKKGDLIRVTSTGECLRATSDGSSATLAVARGVGGVSAVSAATSTVVGTLVIIGHATPQGSSLPTMLITQQTRNYNYGQIQRKAWGFDRTARQSSWYSQNVLDSERDKKLSELKTDRENTVFFGARSYTSNGDSSGHPLGTAGGLIEYISTNVTDISGASGVLATTALENFLTQALQYGSQDKVFFVAPKLGQAISHLLSSNWVRAQPDERVYGAKVDAVISGAFGAQIPVIVKQQWGAYGTGTAGQYGSLGFLVDLSSVRLATMQAPVRLSNRQANDLDGIEEEYLCEETLVVPQESHHALLKNVTSGGT
jgi:hypothetical protein